MVRERQKKRKHNLVANVPRSVFRLVAFTGRRLRRAPNSQMCSHETNCESQPDKECATTKRQQMVSDRKCEKLKRPHLSVCHIQNQSENDHIESAPKRL